MSVPDDTLRESLFGETPFVADSAFVSKLSYLIGDVAVGERASLWPFTCLRGDGGAVTVGDETNVQEFSMLHGADVGDRVTVGHSVVVDYATVEDDCLVGMNSCVLRDATVESGSIVAAGAVVLQEQTVPAGHLAYGAPAQTKPLTDGQRDEITRVHEHYVELSREYRETGRFE